MTPLERFKTYMAERYGEKWSSERSFDICMEAKSGFAHGCLFAWSELRSRTVGSNPLPQAFVDFDEELSQFVRNEFKGRDEKESASQASV